jgi:hypothetical protein
VWARVDKIDRIRPQPGGSAIVLVEDERNAAGISRVPGLSTTIAIARILNARRVLELRYAGKGEVRYAAAASSIPQFFADAITRSGASLADRSGDRVIIPPVPAAIGPMVDLAFAELAHYTRSAMGQQDMAAALKLTEERRRKAPLDRVASPAQYWTAVFELAALAGELSRPRGGRWIETTDTPVPFAIKLGTGELARPAKRAQAVVDGIPDEASLAE